MNVRHPNAMWALFQSLFNPNPQNKFQISPGQNIPLQETSLQDSGNAQETQNESPTQIFSSQDTSDPYKFNIFVYNNNNYNTHHNYHIYDQKKNSWTNHDCAGFLCIQNFPKIGIKRQQSSEFLTLEVNEL